MDKSEQQAPATALTFRNLWLAPLTVIALAIFATEGFAADDTAPEAQAKKQHVVIEGRVTNDSGEPLEGVVVSPFRVGTPSVRTNRAGYYYLPYVLRGKTRSFAVHFRQAGFREHLRTINVNELPDSGKRSIEVRLRPAQDLVRVAAR